MYKQAYFAILTFALVICSLNAIANPRIAVVDFDNRTPHGGWKVGRGAADMLTTHLVKETDFDIIERDRLNGVLNEQNLGASGVIDTNTAVKIGKILGVQYIVTGAVTEYGQSKSGGGGGGVNVGKSAYYSAVDVRVVNTTTGRIVFAESGEGSKSSVNVKVFGFGGGERWNDKHATASMRQAIKKVASQLADADFSGGGKNTASGNLVKDVKVADVDGKLITLNRGANAGLKKGDVLKIKRQRKVIKDPETGAIIKIKYTQLGKIKVTELDDSYSEAIIMEGAGFQIGDIAASN